MPEDFLLMNNGLEATQKDRIVAWFYILTREALCVWRNCEGHSPRNNCCSGKAINILYSENVFVTLFIQHANSMRHIVICGLFDSAILFHIVL